MPSEDLIALRKIAEEFARSAVSQQKIAEHLVTVTLIQSKAIAELIDTVQELARQVSFSRDRS